MVMNIGLVLLFVLIFSYVLIPPIFSQGSYLDAVRSRYSKVFGGEWTRRKNFFVEQELS